MKYPLTLIFALLISSAAFSQEFLYDIKLTSEEKEAIKVFGKVDREVREYISSDKHRCQGALEIYKSIGKPEFNQIGEWKYYYPDSTLRDHFVFDDKGYLQSYKFYEPNGFNSYSCTYEFKLRKGKLYRIEHSKHFYDTGQMKLEGYRCNEIEIEGGLLRRKLPKYIGLRTYYDKEGNVVKQKKNKMGLAKRLGLVTD